MEIQLEMPDFGLRPTTDSLVLCRSVEVAAGERVADLGSGIGNVALNLAARFDAEFHGFEIQAPLHRVALRNLERNREALKGAVEFHRADVGELPESPWAGTFDRVVMNPPWYPQGSGRLSPDPVRAAATHELLATLDDFLRAAAALLKTGGACHLILIAERRAALEKLLGESALSPRTLRPILTRPTDPPKWWVAVLHNAAPGPLPRVLPPELA